MFKAINDLLRPTVSECRPISLLSTIAAIAALGVVVIGFGVFQESMNPVPLGLLLLASSVAYGLLYSADALVRDLKDWGHGRKDQLEAFSQRHSEILRCCQTVYQRLDEGKIESAVWAVRVLAKNHGEDQEVFFLISMLLEAICRHADTEDPNTGYFIDLKKLMKDHHVESLAEMAFLLKLA